MSIFPTKILLATDGSREAQLAARTAADLSQKTNSELQVVYAFGIAPVGPRSIPKPPTSRVKSSRLKMRNASRAPSDAQGRCWMRRWRRYVLTGAW
jgi:nucleotide-binding universal stress UspA family protein